MTSAIFETEKFRVHITGKTAWVETKDGAGWIFCNQHALPVSMNCDDSTGLKAAVDHYEETRRGDASLRAALTGLRTELRKMPAQRANPAIAAARFAQRPPHAAARGSQHRRKVIPHYYGFRAPLRPPLSPALPNS